MVYFPRLTKQQRAARQSPVGMIRMIASCLSEPLIRFQDTEAQVESGISMYLLAALGRIDYMYLTRFNQVCHLYSRP